MKLPTASRLELASRCIGSTVLRGDDGGASPYASRGTVIHAYLEAVSRLGREAALEQIDDESERASCAVIDLERLPVDPKQWAAEVALAFDVRTGRAREIGRSIGRDYSAATDDELVGTADVIGLTTDAAVVLDFKTGHAHLPPPEDHKQLRFLALAAARAYGRTSAVVELIRIREDGTAWRTSGRLDLYDLAAIAEETRELAADVRRWQAADTLPPLRLGEWCGHCPAVSRCPAQVGLVRALAGDPDDIVASFEDSLTPERAAEAYGKLKAIGKLVERLEVALDHYAEQNPFTLGDGRVYGSVEVKRDSIDGRTAWAVIAERYGDEAAWAASDLKVTKAAISRLIRPVAREAGKKIAHLERELLGEIDNRGGLKTSYTPAVRAHAAREGKR